MKNNNTLISGDNKGYASMLFEMEMNPNDINGEVGKLTQHYTHLIHLLLGEICSSLCSEQRG